MNNNDRITELVEQIKANEERAGQLSANLPKMKDLLTSKFEAQKLAIIEGGEPTDLETEILLLRVRIEGVNNAVQSLVTDSENLKQAKKNIE